MADPYALPPSAQPRDVSFQVPADLDPYLVYWYQETKLDGESVNDFLLRRLGRPALEYRYHKLQGDLGDEYNAVRGALGP